MSNSHAGQTPIEAQPENNTGIATDQQFLDGVAEWEGPDYAKVRIPDERERPKYEWAPDERQAELFRRVREHGHPDNVPGSQREIGEEFGVSQQRISQDFDRIRNYIAAHAGERAISDTKMIVDRAKTQLLEDDPKAAVEVQMKFNDWLFDMGVHEREPERKQIQSITQKAEDMTQEQREHFDQLADIMRDRQDADVIDAEEVDDDE